LTCNLIDGVYTLPNGTTIHAMVSTWHHLTNGAHGYNRSSYVLSDVDDGMDRFLNDYLKANQ
jgi:hypothetical protein